MGETGRKMRLKHEPKADQRDVERREIWSPSNFIPLYVGYASRRKMTLYNLPNSNPVTRQNRYALMRVVWCRDLQRFRPESS